VGEPAFWRGRGPLKVVVSTPFYPAKVGPEEVAGAAYRLDAWLNKGVPYPRGAHMAGDIRTLIKAARE
jgi:hypothetical protein